MVTHGQVQICGLLWPKSLLVATTGNRSARAAIQRINGPVINAAVSGPSWVKDTGRRLFWPAFALARLVFLPKPMESCDGSEAPYQLAGGPDESSGRPSVGIHGSLSVPHEATLESPKEGVRLVQVRQQEALRRCR